MRVSLLLVSCMAGVLACAGYQAPEPPPPPNADLTQIPPVADRHVYCFIDGRTMSCDAMQTRDPAEIDRIRVIKGNAAVDLYGALSAGAILVTSKPTAGRPVTGPADEPFYFIDGRTASRSDLSGLPRDSIAHIEVLMGRTARVHFGSAARAGVVLVTTNRIR